MTDFLSLLPGLEQGVFSQFIDSLQERRPSGALTLHFKRSRSPDLVLRVAAERATSHDQSAPDHHVIYGVVQDVTEGIEAATAQLQRNNYIRAILDKIPAAVIDISSSGTVLEVNNWVCSQLGYDRPDLVGRNISLMMPEPYRTEHDTYIRNFLSTGRSTIIGRGRYVPVQSKSGQLRNMFLHVDKHEWQGEQHFVGILTDSPQALLHGQDFGQSELSAVLKAMDCWVLVTDHDLIIRSIHNGHLLPTSFTIEELIGKHFETLLPTECIPRLKTIQSEIKAGGLQTSMKLGGESSGKTVRKILHFDSAGANSLVIHCEDLSQEQISLEEKSALLREMVHRVKNNFQVLDSLVALHRVKLVHEECAAVLDAIRSRIFNLGLVHECLFRSNDLSTIDLHDYLHKIVENLAGDSSKNSRFTLLTAPFHINIDSESASRCGCILNELVTNSIKYAFTPGLGSVAAYWLAKKGELVSLYYLDDGPFYTGKGSTLGYGGIGTMIVESFIETLRGKGRTIDMKVSDPSFPQLLRDAPQFQFAETIRCYQVEFPLEKV